MDNLKNSEITTKPENIEQDTKNVESSSRANAVIIKIDILEDTPTKETILSINPEYKIEICYKELDNLKENDTFSIRVDFYYSNESIETVEFESMPGITSIYDKSEPNYNIYNSFNNNERFLRSIKVSAIKDELDFENKKLHKFVYSDIPSIKNLFARAYTFPYMPKKIERSTTQPFLDEVQPDEFNSNINNRYKILCRCLGLFVVIFTIICMSIAIFGEHYSVSITFIIITNIISAISAISIFYIYYVINAFCFYGIMTIIMIFFIHFVVYLLYVHLFRTEITK